KSQKNPVYYVQYAHARIAGILRNAAGADVGADPPGPLAEQEKELIKRLTDFPVTVREAAERRGPPPPPPARAQAGGRLPPLLRQVPRPRRPGAGVPPRVVRRDPAGDRTEPGPGRGRGAATHVAAPVDRLA